ncbi:MAG: hypothetical protein ACR2NE_03920 [Pirellulales bacterium]
MHRAFNVISKLTLLLAVLSFTFTGCGYRRPAQVKTTGIVTLDGEPVADAALMFIPTQADLLPATQTRMESFRFRALVGMMACRLETIE